MGRRRRPVGFAPDRRPAAARGIPGRYAERPGMAAADRAFADGRDGRRGRHPAGTGPAPAGLRQALARGLDGHPPP